MTRINKADEILLLLRAHLERTQRARRPAQTASSASAARAGPLGRVKQRAGLEKDEDLGRTLIAGLLAEEFGPALANDAHFQHLIDDVLRLVASDAETKHLLDSALKRLAQP